MPVFLRTIARRAAPVLRSNSVTQTANLYSRPAKEKIGPFETIIAIGLFAGAILGPSGWVLSHLEDYKKRE
ncbi:cytochrome c oxidase subunit 8A, mitochondrial [Nematolebias whitei]|uniref:cytochrome c oxidase subunit 8A, mitochondrial n=1 Tax=Nematolebias whitei TaxID=451745 RepID=UPI001897BD4A|nr:cytochrome c oxidase subunit 8A, mitochondrial [Nematolebias whitei]